MRRHHLIELEDLPWFPAAVRDGATDFLAFAGNALEAPYAAFVPRLAAAMRRTGDTRLLDLCSGGSGPVKMLVRLLRREGIEARATLTDLYPNIPKLRYLTRGAPELDFVSAPVDATRVPRHLEGFRVICNAFHHFRPELALQLLADAVEQRRGIAVLEFVERSPASMALIPLASMQSALAAPLIRPFRLSRLALSWAVPLIPFTVLWDGLVSCVRAYSAAELRALTDQLPDARYRWQIQRDAFGPLGSTTLIGIPEERT